jgi:hypothetical protein
VQLPPAATGELVLQVPPLAMLKSDAFVPVIEILLIVRDVEAELFNVADCAELVVPTFWLENVSGEVKVTVDVTPVPERATVWGLPVALSATLILAEREPSALGLKVTLMVQLPPAATGVLVLHVPPLATAKSDAFVPVMEILLIVSDPAPLLVSVVDLAELVVFWAWFPNEMEVGLKVGGGSVPVPVRESLWGLPEALSATLILALREPVAVGLKVTLMVQLPPAATGELVLHVPPLAMLKSDAFVPVIEMLLIVSGPVPVFFSVVDWAALVVPTFCAVENVIPPVKLATGWVPVPEMASDCGVPLALSETLTLALRVPVAVGLNVTLIVQLPFADSEELVVQVPPLAIAKSEAFVPVMENPLSVSVPPPLFVTVTAWAALVVPTSWPEKVKPPVGVKLAVGAAAPVPERLTDCGLFRALSLTIRLPVRVPVPVGVKVTVIVQLLLPLVGGSAPGQLSLSA